MFNTRALKYEAQCKFNGPITTPIRLRFDYDEQEAQLPQRNIASTAHMEGGG